MPLNGTSYSREIFIPDGFAAPPSHRIVRPRPQAAASFSDLSDNSNGILSSAKILDDDEENINTNQFISDIRVKMNYQL